MTDILLFQWVNKRLPQIIAPSERRSCSTAFDLFSFFLIKAILCWSWGERPTHLHSLVPLYLAEISVTLWESKSELSSERPALMKKGSDPRRRSKIGITAVERVKRVRSGRDWADWAAAVLTACWLWKQPVAFRCRF